MYKLSLMTKATEANASKDLQHLIFNNLIT